ncbi:TlpA family protein disulfide reductase [Kribbella sp. DT2]|uniref:TlpA family protein disulfide reductase n=1 Tax=Kribbella sp. DT2 TaxID=3393427 RepID=UPI003CECF93C
MIAQKHDASRRRRTKPVAVMALIAAATAGSALAWHNDFWSAPPVSRAAQKPATEAAATGLTRYAAGARSEAPDVRGQTLDGEQLALRDLRDQVAVVNVWGSWCQPCRKEAPDLAQVARETARRGVRFVGIDTRDNPAAARAFVRAFKVPYPSLIDDGGQLILDFHGVIPVSAVPSTVIVDPAGKIAARVVGIVNYATLRGLVDDVLAETPDPASTASVAKKGTS